MKKNYIKPQILEEEILVEYHVCADSNFGIGDTQDDDLTPLSKDDDFEEWDFVWGE